MTFQTEETFPGKSLLTISWMHHKIQSCHVSMWFAVMLVYNEDTPRNGWWSWKQFGHRRTAVLSHKLLCWVRSFTTHLSQNTFDQLYLDMLLGVYFALCHWIKSWLFWKSRTLLKKVHLGICSHDYFSALYSTQSTESVSRTNSQEGSWRNALFSNVSFLNTKCSSPHFRWFQQQKVSCLCFAQ